MYVFRMLTIVEDTLEWGMWKCSPLCRHVMYVNDSGNWYPIDFYGPFFSTLLNAFLPRAVVVAMNKALKSSPCFFFIICLRVGWFYNIERVGKL